MLSHRSRFTAAMAVACYAAQAVAQTPESTSALKIDNALVVCLQEAEVPSQEAGVLAEINVRPGSTVRAGEVLARVNDRRAEIEKRLAQVEYNNAREKADNDINVRYSKAAAAVAEAEYQAAVKTNERVPGSFPAIEIRKLMLQHNKSLLQIQQAELEQTVARGEAQVAAAKLEAADEVAKRHKIISSIDGVVDDVRAHVGEWVQPGDVVAHVRRLDKLSVICYVREEDRARLNDGNCVVEVTIPGLGARELRCQRVFVSDGTQNNRDFRVQADVENRQENGGWLLHPGKQVTLRVE